MLHAVPGFSFWYSVSLYLKTVLSCADGLVAVAENHIKMGFGGGGGGGGAGQDRIGGYNHEEL
jgi:hypothetical protein